MNYGWPGNIREMENVIEYALHLADDGNPIRPEQLPPSCSPQEESAWSSHDIVSIEEYIQRAIAVLQKDHSEEQIADTLGISRKNLWEKRKRWDLQKSKKKKTPGD